MDTAVSLYRAGEIRHANEVTYSDVVSLRLACPECLEPVTLVIKVKKGSRYFAHYPQKRDSPECPLRVKSSGGSIYRESRKRAKEVFEQDVFQRAFLVVFGIAYFPRLVSPYRQAIEKLVESMQRVWLAKKQCINISDLLVPPRDYLRKWTHPGRLIQGYVSERDKDFPRLAPIYKSSKPKKQAKEQAITVLLLWCQLHLEQVEKDLRFLLQLSYHMYKRDMAHINRKTRSQASYSMISGYLMFNALKILSAVPWAKVPTLVGKASDIKCASCRKYFLQVPQIEVKRCSVCGKPLCLCCGEKYRCQKCYSELCKGCSATHVC